MPICLVVLQPRFSEVTAYLGETVQFECQSQGHPQPRITWVLPDREIVHSSGPTHGNPENKVSVLPNGTLHMKSVSHMDRGIYKCIASNAAGADTISVRLTIAALPPIIHSIPHSLLMDITFLYSLMGHSMFVVSLRQMQGGMNAQ
uniref:Ig-like domain-containing protein n=1 Tax=Cyprinus carpio TaxID=7962 RepID=A0A8C2F9F0_CYPCA